MRKPKQTEANKYKLFIEAHQGRLQVFDVNRKMLLNTVSMQEAVLFCKSKLKK